jgi:phospholipase C
MALHERGLLGVRESVSLILVGALWLAPGCTVQIGASHAEDGGSGGGGSGGNTGDGGSRLCGAGQASCSGTCIDITADDKNCGGCGMTCSSSHHCAVATCQESKIQHVVLIVEENHTFESYFGLYCQAAPGSSPTCTNGPQCCEGAPSQEPRGATPLLLDDDPNNAASNFATDRDHVQACELQQIDHGKMDGFVSGSTGSSTCLGVGPDCASAYNWALADRPTVGAYWLLADGNGLADRYFQPVVGGTSSNNMYFAEAHYQFLDNSAIPNTIGTACTGSPCEISNRVSYTGRTTIADLLLSAGKTFAVYADGYGDAKVAAPSCPAPSSDCRYAPTFTCNASLHPLACHTCIYDPTDIPFAYYEQLGDKYIRDYATLTSDLAAGSLPNFAFVKAKEWHNEHPNVSTIADGIAFVTNTIKTIQSSPYANKALILVTWDEGGGFFDHISPPQSIDVDSQGSAVPYGTRVPLLVIGPFARKGTVSHVQMEHSSIVRFLEYNFLGPVGQLGFNDAKVNNIGSLLDPSTTGFRIPEQ